MKRRQLLQHLFSSGFLLLARWIAFPRWIRAALGAQSFYGQRAIQLHIAKTGKTVSIPVLQRLSIEYIDAHEFARALGLHTYFNSQKQKLVIYLPGNKILLTANNPFVIIDTRTLQMPATTIWHNGKIWVPIRFFLPLLSRHTNFDITLSDQSTPIQITERAYTVTGISIDERANGTVIRIHTLKKYGQGEMVASMRNGWLHVDLYGGKGDVALLEKTPVSGLVRSIRVTQFPELISIAFLLKEKPRSRELFQEEWTNDVVVVLRTVEELPEESSQSTSSNHTDQKLEEQLRKERARWLIDKVVIDPGHGGKDPGAPGVHGIWEKDITLAIALRLGKMIEQKMPDVKVVYTRKSDRFIAVKERTRIANQHNAKVFISIHANSNKNRKVSGFETYILGPERGDDARNVVLTENAVIKYEKENQESYKGLELIMATMAQSAFMKQSEYLASLVQEELDKRLKPIQMKNRGVKQGPFWVMVGATMPSILIETGFITNPFDARILRTRKYQKRIAEGIFAGLQRFKNDYENAI